MNAWIKWSGGECPVSPDTIIDIRYRVDYIVKEVEARWLNFEHLGECDDIIAYRICE